MASPLTFTQLNQLYLAYFGRPVDFNGYVYYTSNNATVSDVAYAFSTSAESQALYGTGTVASQVNAIYVNLFNRPAELAGLAYWTGQIASGAISAPQAALQILMGAQGTDATCISNKLTAAQSFFNVIQADTTGADALGYAGTAAAASARVWLSAVTSDSATLPSTTAVSTAVATAVAAGTAAAGQVYNLTVGIDTLVGGSGNDTFNAQLSPVASLNTFGALDSVDGGAGANTLNINDTNTGGATTVPSGVTIKNIQTINVNSAQSVGNVATVPATTFDVSSQSGLTTLNVTSIGADNIKAAATTNVTVSDSVNAAGLTAAVAGGNNVTITTSGSSAATVTADGTAGALTINQSTGGAITVGGTTAVKGAVTITDTNMQTGNIAVDGGTNVSVTASTKTFTGTTGTITIGNTTKPTGTVSVTENLNGQTGANLSGNTITVKGGTTVTVTENAVQPTNTASTTPGATIANQTTTQGNVVVNGSGVTTSVVVTQTAAVTEKDWTTAKAGVNETDVFSFTTLANTSSAMVGGLTFKNTSGSTMTAAQVAAAFANLTSGAIQGNSTLGTYSGTFASGWSTGAVSSTNTVTATDATAATVVAPATPPTLTADGVVATVATGTTGVTAVPAVTGVGGISTGSVTITDAGAGSGTGTINYVQLSAYASASITDDALATLSLANSAGAVTVKDVGGATGLSLTVNHLGTGSTLDLDNATANQTYTSLNITTAGADSVDKITAAKVTALTVAGTNAIDLSGSTLTALQKVTVSGSAGVTLASGANVTDINASATSGNMTVTNFNANAATYEGGSGADTVTLNNVLVSKAISLGAGNDSLTLASGTGVPTATVDGGAGTDTLTMAASDAVTDSGNALFAGKVVNFEVLGLTGGTGAQTVHVDVLGNYNSVTTGGEAAGGVLTMDGFTSGGTLTLTSAAVGGAYVVSSAAFATPTTDVFNIAVSTGATADAGQVTANKVETINLSSNDTVKTDAAGTITNTLKVLGDSVTAITVTGNANLNLTGANTTVSSVDASAMTGGLTYTAAGTVAETVKGGAGANTLTASTGTAGDTLIGGAGNDTLKANAGLDTLTGNGGKDTFVIQTASTNLNTYATITDAHVGDVLQFVGNAADTFTQSKLTLASTAVFQDYANAIVHTVATTAGAIAWFQYGGDTYVIQNETGAEASFTNGTDLIVKLAGLVDLSHTSISPVNGTLLIG